MIAPIASMALFTPMRKTTTTGLSALTITAALFAAPLAPATQAQITPDSTLGAEASRMTPETLVQGDLADLIEGGAIRGGNLFHSFLEFNVDLGQRVYFANPAGIESILSRVTGGDPSAIFGTLGVDGAADLFLINPNGIVFEENASLDIQGSFYATTAEAIPLGEGVYSATAPEQSSLLTVNPSALFSSYLSDASGDIENRGQLAAGENLTLAGNNLDLQGQVAAGGDLTLLGNAVQIRDTVAVPFVGFAGGDLLAQGNERVDIVALSHADSGLYSYGDMVLRSANPVGGDAHYWSGGNFRVEGLDGESGDLFSPIDPIIRTFGDVVIQAYQGSSLHILAGGSVNIDTAVITAPDPGTLGLDFLQETITLSDGTIVQINGAAQPTLDVRAGINPTALGTPPLEILTGFDPATDTFFGAAFVTDLPSTADITVGDVLINAPNGFVLLTNQYQPNPNLAGGSILVTGDGLYGNGINVRGQGGQGGAVYLDARNDVFIDNSLIATSGAGTVGDIVINAGDTVRFERQDRRTGAVSDLVEEATGTAGDIRIRATNVELINGAQLGASTFGTGNAGNVVIEARDRVIFDNGDVFSDVVAGATGSGGNVEITANALEVTNGAQLSASTFGVGDAGSVILDITELARFVGTDPMDGSPSGAGSQIAITGEGRGGDVQITARTLEVLDGAVLSASTFGTGDAGSVILTITELARFVGSDPTGSSRSGASSSIEPTGEGRGGNVQVTARALEVLDGAELAARTRGIGNAGNVVIHAQDHVVFGGVTADRQFGSVASTAVAAGANGSGGNVIVIANDIEIRNGALLTALTRGVGNAGNVVIQAQNSVIFNGTSNDGEFVSAAATIVGSGALGMGGNVEITTGTLDVSNGAQLLASTEGIGDAGNVIIQAREPINIQGTSISGRPSGILTNNTDSPTGQSNDIRIASPVLRLQDGAVLLASTRNNQPGGDIILSLGKLEVLGGGQIVSSSGGEGAAGTIRIEATDDILISGNDPSFGVRAEQISEVELLFVPQSSISVRATGEGAAGSIIIGELGTTPRLLLDNGGQLIAESAAVDGGNILINLNNVLLMRNGSLISTTAGTAQAGGNGGNITITVPFIIAIPAENSDIAADAFEGAGGNVTITARGIFGIEPRSERTPLSDITASSELGFSGVVTLNTLDTSAIENSLTDLADVVIDTAALTAGSCIARTDESLGSFTVTGSGGLPQRPGDSAISAYPTGTVQTLTTPAATHTLLEPDGVYQLPDGRLVLSRACE
jgi:filamentous hemagglutinin family protein